VPRGRPRKFDTEEVLEKAMELFWTEGYQGASTADLLTSAGIARQSLYRTFGDKRTLFIRALRFYGRRVMGGAREMLGAPGSPLANIEKVFDYWEALCARPDSPGCLVANTTADFGISDAEVAAILREELEAVTAAFEDALERAREKGEIDPSADCRALARTLTCIGQGVSLMGRLSLGEAAVRDVLRTVRKLIMQPKC